MTISERIWERIFAADAKHAANDNIAEFLLPGEMEALEHEVESVMESLLYTLVIEYDENTRDTAKRMARMYLREFFAGRYQPRPEATDFPNTRQLDELYTVGPIGVRSICAHHLVPVTGEAWVGVIPGERIIGLSKFSRIAQWVMARPQVQEEAVIQLADEIERTIRPKGLAVLVRATHACMTARGVRDPDATMTTSVMRGLLADDDAARNEFLALIRGQGF
ncbi:GTP cyclohydrolase I [Cupriavidus taiwanensis]|uniref:GTP cyclohydrolase I n=1 Tax=Cupriavidus taiwanensis TaxID=164546 RepID=UPI000E159F5B|nr:GTP cyclohydrolase I [Cupriavidus taiwanensis]SPA17234.1 GTP cyclohydrolase 1 [Cupriavidus taiwanensis]